MSKKKHWFFCHLPEWLLLLVLLTGGVFLLRRGYHHYMTTVFPCQYSEEVTAASENFGITPSLIYAVIHTESEFQADALSHADAKGLMQLTDDTFAWALSRSGDTGKYTTEDLYDPAVNIHYGVYVLELLWEQFDDKETVLAAYNAGMGNVRSWLADTAYSADGNHLDTIPYKETENYVRRVLQAQTRYQELYKIP